MLGSYLGPFILTFIISLFIFEMQFLWKYVDDLMGKGLETMIILELLVYASSSLVNLALRCSAVEALTFHWFACCAVKMRLISAVEALSAGLVMGTSYLASFVMLLPATSRRQGQMIDVGNEPFSRWP